MPESNSPRIHHTTVQASAGSGKTYLLISRIVRLLLSGVSPGNILAITFTRKAANEMQTRLLERLYNLATQPDSELDKIFDELELEPSQHDYNQARGLYEKILRSPFTVNTTTFHAFCQDLLRKFPMEADVPPGFNLLDQTTLLIDQAWEDLMNKASSDVTLSSALQTLFSEIGLYNTKEALYNFLQHRSDWWAYIYNENNPLEYANNTLLKQLNIDPSTDYRHELFNSAPILNKLGEFNSLLVKHETKTNLTAAENIGKARDTTLDNSVRYGAFCAAFLTREGKPLATRKRSDTLVRKIGEDGVDTFLSLHHELSTLLVTVNDKLAAQNTYKISQSWYRAGHELIKFYQKIKLEQRFLDFTDLEWKAYELLNHSNNALWIQYKLDQRIEHLLIDEFQDTNPTQWRLILPLLQEIAASEKSDSHSVFLVGDTKQSIYRFRRAEPRLFATASEWLTDNLAATSIQLSHSWRSSPAVINHVNTIFNHEIFTPLMPDYPLHDTHKNDLWGKVTLLPAIKQQDSTEEEEDTLRNPLQQPRIENNNDAYYFEGKLIADEILKLIKNKTPVTGSSGHRVIDYDDIIILLRNRTHVADFERALREKNIPYIGANRGTLLESLEVNDMLDLLEWLILPFNNLSLAGILRSPVFSFNDHDLIKLAQIPGVSWLTRLDLLNKQSPGNKKYHYAFESLTRWQSLAQTLPVHDLLDKIYSEANIINRYCAAFPQHLAATVKANLNRFLELALEMDSGRYPSLTRFAIWLNELRQLAHDAPDEPVSDIKSKRVRIMSIHAAKGLEAAVIFLADSTSIPGNNDAYNTLIDWPAEKYRPDYLLLSLSKKSHDAFTRQCIDEQKILNKREEANLLYVALTRAKQFLFISGTWKKEKITGWYSDIMKCYDLTTDDINNPYILSELVAAPELTTQISQTSETDVTLIDSRLSKPIQTHNNIEISPSQADEFHMQAAATEEDDGRLRGILIHKMLDYISSNSDPSFETSPFQYNSEANDTQLRNWWDECIRIINSDKFSHIFNTAYFDNSYNELPVQFKYNDKMVYGIIDRIVLKGSNIHIIDYKTHLNADKNNIQTIAQQYQQQLQLYTHGCRLIWPEHKFIASLLFTHPGILHTLNQV